MLGRESRWQTTVPDEKPIKEGVMSLGGLAVRVKELLTAWTTSTSTPVTVEFVREAIPNLRRSLTAAGMGYFTTQS